jgi:hypothetical protein
MPVKFPVATRKYSDYTLCPDIAETAVQGATPTESYSNFGLGNDIYRSRFRIFTLSCCTWSTFDIEGKHVTIQGSSPDLRPAAILAPSACTKWLPSLLIRRYVCGHPHPFRSVPDLGRFSTRCPYKSGEPERRSPAWLPAWLPGPGHVRHHRPGTRCRRCQACCLRVGS